MEKRFFRRVNVRGGICKLTRNETQTGTIENISLGGLFVKSAMMLAAEEKIKISITLQRQPDDIRIETEAIATRREDGGIAFKYDSLNPKDFWTLQSYVQGLTR